MHFAGGSILRSYARRREAGNDIRSPISTTTGPLTVVHGLEVCEIDNEDEHLESMLDGFLT